MMTRQTVTAWTKATRQLIALQALLLLLWPLSFELFINIEIAFFSAFFVMLGSMYSYAKLVHKRVEGYESGDGRDAVDRIEDPFDLYETDEPQAADAEDVDIRAIIKEEKQRIKASGAVKNATKSAPAMVSLYRIVPYGLLVLGFIALKNNDILSVWTYLIGLGLGIPAGLYVGKGIFTRPSV